MTGDESARTETGGSAEVERTPRQRALHILWQTVSWILLIAAFAVLFTTIVIPKVAGARPYSVLTGSMRPDYPPGTLIVVKPRPFSSIEVGDVVTYQVKSGQPGVVTHRVVGFDKSPSGQPRLITKGDANSAVDPPVRPVQVRGVLWYSVPLLGCVNTWFSGAKRTLTVFVLAGLLFAYGAWQFYTDWRQERRDKAAAEAAAGPADDTPTETFAAVHSDAQTQPIADASADDPLPERPSSKEPES
ncbi:MULTISPECIES: signal peptidase I [Gordonia]|uniref:Signal peptidase I n=1 Tax=Gordonia cholesterolivorans TaxID=559625 RepID=A0ABN3HI43_9ACTN|nr:signal peptidase I [Gordonia sihwensis]KJR09723.1 signal peptidase I [Gordonia sihwensis]